MKKIVTLVLCAVLCVSLFAGCGKSAAPAATETAPSEPAYATSLELMEAIWQGMPQDDSFPAAGGDEAQDTEGPGAFDVNAYGETFQYQILLDDTLMDALTGDAATLMHMMNTNTFCSAVMQLKEGTDAASFADHYQELVQSNHWMCGFPDTVVVLNLGSFMITAYGADDLIQQFKNSAASLGANVLVEAPAEA